MIYLIRITMTILMKVLFFCNNKQGHQINTRKASTGNMFPSETLKILITFIDLYSDLALEFHRDLQGLHYHFWMEWIWYHFEDLKVHFFPLEFLKSVSKWGYFGSFHCSSNKWQSSSNSWWQSKGDWLMSNRWTKRMERNYFYKSSVHWCKKARISWVKVAEDWSQKTCQPPGWGYEPIAILWLVGYCCYSFWQCTVFWFFWISDRFWGWRRWVPWRERCPKERFWWCSCSTWCKMDCP